VSGARRLRAVLYADPETGWFGLRAPCVLAWVDEIKRRVASFDRQWRPDLKAWRFRDECRAMVLEITGRHYPKIETAPDPLSPPARPAKARMRRQPAAPAEAAPGPADSGPGRESEAVNPPAATLSAAFLAGQRAAAAEFRPRLEEARRARDAAVVARRRAEERLAIAHRVAVLLQQKLDMAVLGNLLRGSQPPPWAPSPWETLARALPETALRAARAAAVQASHPDAGGSNKHAAEVNAAWDAIRKEKHLR
jgi:hypothetical protein